MTKLVWDPSIGIWAEDPSSVEKLIRDQFGQLKKGEGKVFLTVEEALYLLVPRNAECERDGKPVTFNELASFYNKDLDRIIIKYNTYRDWRDRGLIMKRLEGEKGSGKKSYKKYPEKKIRKLKLAAMLHWYSSSMFSILDDDGVGKDLFNDFWFGQYGIYKQERGSLLKLSFLETVFLSKHFGASIMDVEKGKEVKWKEVLKEVVKKREYTRTLFDIYEEWRLNGYVVKTGFKFGSHFRIYFPGASPVKMDKWIHSKHVLHVFPKEEKLIISEWARAVRVAHGVKKTFILGIPKLGKEDYVDYPADFIAYRRRKDGKNWLRETPKDDSPRYLLVPVSEDEHIGGIELASLLEKSKRLGLELILSINDRETSITYYILKKVVLPGSKYEYYEIEWMKP